MTAHISLKAPLNPGKYVTRDGGEAWVDAPPTGAQMSVTIPFLVGWVKSMSGYTPATWAPDGRYMSTKNDSILDLVGPWIDKPEWDWQTTPPWLNWLVMDISGRWYLYDNKPLKNNESWYGIKFIDVPNGYAPKWSGDWKDSLVGRPGVEVKP